MLILSVFQEYKHGNTVLSINITKDFIASGSSDKSCQVWNLRQKKLLYTVKHDAWVRHVKLFPSGSNYDLISSSSDKIVKFWKQGQLVRTLEHSDDCYNFSFDSEQRMLAVANWEGIAVWSTSDWKKLADLKIGWIVDVHFNSTSTKILAAGSSGEISIIDLE